MDFLSMLKNKYRISSHEVCADAENVKKFTNDDGVEFAVRVIYRGDKYGRDFKLTYDDDKPTVEFYDTKYPHTQYGQFISRYNLSTLLPLSSGIDLAGNVPRWKIDQATMADIVSWLKTKKK